MNKTVKRKKMIKKGRLVFIFLGLCLLFILLISRIAYISTFKGKAYKAIAMRQWINTISIAPKRGRILDRNGQVMALSNDVYRVDVDLMVLLETISKNKKKLTVDSLSEEIADTLQLEKEDVLKIMNRTDKNGLPLRYTSIKRKVSKEQADSIKALKLNGIIVSQDTQRFYPNDNFLSNVIGHTNSNGDGVSGVELTYNKELIGVPGIKVVERDMSQNDLPYSEEQDVEPINGKDIYLTIDEKIQEIAETVAENTLKSNNAKAVNIVVMNPNNGEILALVNKPDYDPNYPSKVGQTSEEIQETWKNKSVSSIFEPGSIFKAITSAAALEKKHDLINETFICTGSIKVGDSILYCDKRKAHGVETFSDIIKNSCNVGFVELSQKLGVDNFYDFVLGMGFNHATGTDLPGESTGILREKKASNIVENATMSYGQGLAVTQIQYLAAFNTIANGGTWIRPHVMKEISHTESGNIIVDKKYDNYGKKKLMSSENSEVLRSYLQRVVDEGTATATKIDGIKIAGKTGTAQKVNTEEGGYYPDKYVSSFVGMAPSTNPSVSLIITIDEPDSSKYYAGQTAVPAAKELFMGLLNYISIQ